MVFEQWVKYLNNDTSCQWDLTKSVILSGGNGCGKSTFLKWFSILSVHGGFEFPEKKRFEYVEAQTVVDQVLTTGDLGVIPQYYTKREYYAVGLDEIGLESECYVWKNLVYPIEQILVNRHNREKLTFCTTNLDMQDLHKKYGQRLASRISGWNYVELIAKDYRPYL